MADASSLPYEGPALLKAHIKKLGLSIRGAAKQLDVSHVTLLAWLRGKFKPDGERGGQQDAIRKWSGGAVPVGAWRAENEVLPKDVVQRAVPAAPRTS